jgi:hypothetical protein
MNRLLENQIAARHIADQGRGNDTELVHMSPREVAGLQALAQQNGMELPRNPKTGLVEANFLDSILPAIAGIGLSVFAPEAMGALGGVFGGGAGLGSALAVGGADALVTGSLQKGLMAGLGAYGGANIASSLAGAGGAEIGANAARDYISAAPSYTNEAVQGAAADAMQNASLTDKLSMAASHLTDNGIGSAINQMGGYGNLAAVAAPVLAGMGASSTNPSTTAEQNLQNTIRPYQFTQTPTALPGAPGDASKPYFNQTWTPQTPYVVAAGGGLLRGSARGETLHGTIGQLRDNNRLMKYASGGISNLGSYSDGGQLLRGPGDGVSDSIPAQIGQHQPARLAEGEFVVPARIVSELGNGSTNAGAKQLYAMIDRIQSGRRKTMHGDHAYADDTQATRHLPA